MAFKEDFNLFIGAKYGILKGLKVTSGQSTITKSIQSLQHLSKTADVTTMVWGDEDEEEILLGLSNQVVKVYDTNYKAFVSSSDASCTSDHNDTKGSICGLSRYDGALLTANECGHIRLWRYEDETALNIYAGGPLSCMRHSSVNRNIIGTGGLENELKLWDLSTGKITFTAKNVPHDALQLRVKVWVSNLSFLTLSDKVVIGSRYGYVRLYDPKAQRRPVINVDLKDDSISCIAPSLADQTVLCGLAKGNIKAIDLRMGKQAQKYTGFLGAVRDVVCHPTEPYVISVSLDRYLRVHHLHTKALLFKDFTVSRMNCVLVRSNFTLNNTISETGGTAPSDFSNKVNNVANCKTKKRMASNAELPSSKKYKSSTFVNPFASVDENVLQTPVSPKGGGEHEPDSDDDIQILTETVHDQQQFNSESDVDEAEGSSSDLSSDDAED